MVIIIVFLIFASGFDWKEHEIPVALFIIASAGLLVWSQFTRPEILLINFIPGIVLMLLTILFPKHIGIGDGLCLLFMGFAWNIITLLRIMQLACCICAIYGIGMRIFRTNHTVRLAFVPFLTLAALLNVLT